ncbi:MAG: hypothetical protein IH586_17285 [Anaerolineaceae bacterium]|nr:hypothetical protein [Anaerolineaceae bacterium]
MSSFPPCCSQYTEFELQAETFAGDSFAHSSQPLAFTWMYLDDPNSIVVTDGVNGEKVTISNSTCPK